MSIYEDMNLPDIFKAIIESKIDSEVEIGEIDELELVFEREDFISLYRPSTEEFMEIRLSAWKDGKNTL